MALGPRNEEDDIEFDKYDLQTATDRLFLIIDGEETYISPHDEQLAIRLLQRFPNAARTLAQDGGELLLHVACGNHAPEALIQALLQAWLDAMSTRTQIIDDWEIDEVMRPLPLHTACRFSRSLKTIQMLVEAWPMSLQQVYMDIKNLQCLPLHRHLENDTVNLEIVRYLVQQWPESLNVSMWEVDGFYALHLACTNGLPPIIIQFLADQWPKAVRIMTPTKDLPLHIACGIAKTSVETISHLIQMWPESLQVRDWDAYLPLHVACCKNAQNTDMIALLLAKGPQAVCEACPKTGHLPLHLACRVQATLAVLRLLVEAWPAAMFVQDKYLFLPLHYACRKINEISDTEETQSHLERVKLLVEPRPEYLHTQTKIGMLPLHWACLEPMASTNVIRYLVESYPTTVFVRDHKGRLPLHLACAQTTGEPPLEVIQCLVRAWPESIHIPQGKDKRTYCDIEQSESGKHDFDGLPALPLDLVCQAVTTKQRAQPLPELLLLLTNDIPPLHFACAHSWIPARLTTIQYLSLIYPHDRMRFHDGKLPFHHLCLVGAPRCLLEQWPDAISTSTTDTGDFPLHCYLLSNFIVATSNTTTATENSTTTQAQQTSCSDWSAAVLYLAERYPAAMRSSNRNGWLPVHLAAIQDAPLDVLFHLLREVPESVMRPPNVVDQPPVLSIIRKRRRSNKNFSFRNHRNNTYNK